ncbi:hypothetical protein P9112_009316 [Eukaryota sp. TZLM1-RC]
MCKSYRVDSFLEPLLSKLILHDPNIDSTPYNRASMGKDKTRGDLVVPGLNGSFTILDAMSVDPCNYSNQHFINSAVNNFSLSGEKYTIPKYTKPISSVNENSHSQNYLCPLVFALLGSLGKFTLAFDGGGFQCTCKGKDSKSLVEYYYVNGIMVKHAALLML